MAFVKVVGGIEIYNFRIQSFVHFYTIFWSFSNSNSGPAARSGPNAAAPRRHACSRAAHRARAPAGLGIRATRRPRPHAGRGVPLPHAPHPEAPRSPPGPSHAASRRTGPELAADRWSVGGIPPYARRPRSPYYGGISAVTATSLVRSRL
jgi:hypothetical protein